MGAVNRNAIIVLSILNCLAISAVLIVSIVMNNGRVTIDKIYLETNFSTDTQFTPSSQNGNVQSFYLKSFIDGEYRTVSNVVFIPGKNQ